ncbi:MAG: hypothetical protein DHS20C14_14250 [Phycisphaeraceae bacterium]|nr:MAG: hypothetical protein DHS20C14_14250 [Phycisphaeraceae bacterium]
MTPQPPHPACGPFDCLGTSARLVDRTISAIYDDALRPLGIRVTQMGVLVVLARLGGGTATEIAQMLRMDKSTVSRSLDRLIDSGWVTADEGADARTQPLTLTRSGRAMIDRSAPAWAEAQEHVRTLVGDAFADKLVRTAEKLMNQPQ